MLNQPTLALDIGGTRVKAATIQGGRVLASAFFPARSQEPLRLRLPEIEQTLQKLAEGDFARFAGLGIALPCLVNRETGRATEIYEKFTDAPGIDFRAWARERFGLPVVVEQDSKAALMGEAAYGAAQGARDVLLVILGTGVGTAVMLGGRLLDNGSHCAGALGSHILIERQGRLCTCGGRGCLEAYTSGWALPGLVREQPGFAQSALAAAEKIDFAALREAVSAGDAVALRVLNDVTRSLRNGLISLIHAYGPEVVVLSGGPMQVGERFTGPLLDGIQEDLWGSCARVAFRVAQQPEHSVLLGLDALLRRALLPAEGSETI